jgi:Transglycosylase SLT domain
MIARSGTDRRRAPRGGWDRRTVVAIAFASVLATGAAAEAQLYTRRNANGVLEVTNVPDRGDYRLTYPGKGALIHSRSFSMRAYNGEFDQHILAASAVHGVSPDLIKAVIRVESEFDQWAVSSAGARGLMQLMPGTALRFGVINSFDPRQNIFAGVQYLRFLLDTFQNDLSLALAGYNAGENAVLRYRGIPPYKETQAYVQKVQAVLSGAAGASWMAPVRVAIEPVRLVAAYFAPSKTAVAVPPAATRAAPARPKTYYRWSDNSGPHVAQEPPPEGVTFSMIRLLD